MKRNGEVRKLKMTEYMEQHIGEVYEGIISELPPGGFTWSFPIRWRGFCMYRLFPGIFFEYDEAACEMRGTKTGVCYRMGGRIRVKVRFADRFTRSIDFIPADDEAG